jgi:hypothetical protein
VAFESGEETRKAVIRSLLNSCRIMSRFSRLLPIDLLKLVAA